MIDNHTVNWLDETTWDYKCLAGSAKSVFSVNPKTNLTFQDCEISDVRYRPDSFVLLANSGFNLIRTYVLRTDTVLGFIKVKDGSSVPSVLTIEDSLITGMNRDHPYKPSSRTDTGFLISSVQMDIVIRRTTFRDNLVLEPGGTDHRALINVQVRRLELANLLFERCTGALDIAVIKSNFLTTLDNVRVSGHFAYTMILNMRSSNGTNLVMRNCSFIDNHSAEGIVGGLFKTVDSLVVKNNRIMGSTLYTVILGLAGPVINITNCIIEGNGPLTHPLPSFGLIITYHKGSLMTMALQ